MSERHRLPNRRPQLTERLTVAGASYDASIGFDLATGQPREVFIEGPKPGSGMAFIVADASVLISLALQHGTSPAALARSMARVPKDPEGAETEPATIIGAAVDLLVEVEREIATEIEAVRLGAGNTS